MGWRLPGLRTRKDPVTEHKVVLQDYYAALAATGAYSNYRTRPWPVERAVSEAYERLVWVFKAVESISSNVARLPYVIYDDEEEVKDHPLYRVLNKRANPLETGRQFRKRLVAQVLLSKRGAFVELTRTRGGDITRMDLLPPGRTRPVPGTGEELVSHYEVIRADGTYQPIEVENVRWFRDPHPLDPYSGITPLEAAGLSIELDFFSRLYNVAFLRNDARPGGVLAIDGEMNEAEMDRIEGRFAKGPAEAGKLTVINGEVSYVDLAVRPRDMQYETTAQTAKTEILAAFGVPESVLGYSADRTYANSEQELYNFWTVTIPPILDLLTTGFDEDALDTLEGRFDTSGIEVIQRAEIISRDEARKEFSMGLISLDEYRERAGYAPVGLPETRALRLPAGAMLVATSAADKAKLDAEKLKAQEEMFAAQQKDNEEADRRSVAPKAPKAAGASARELEADRRAQPSAAPPLRAVKSAGQPVLRMVRTAAKSAEPPLCCPPDEAAALQLESALSGALGALAVRLTERTAARATSPKFRKGTRHWSAEGPADSRLGTKSLDAERVVEAERWSEEARAAVAPLLQAAALQAASGLARQMGAGLDAFAEQESSALAAKAADDIARAADRQAAHVLALLAGADSAGASADQIAQRVRDHGPHLAQWAARAAQATAAHALSAAREGTVSLLTATDARLAVTRRWHNPEGGCPDHPAAEQPLGATQEDRACRCLPEYLVRRTERLAG